MSALGQYDIVVVTGIGKSALAGDLGAAIMQSVGVRAFSVHATDMMHGGMALLSLASDRRLVIGVSHSGGTRETLAALEKAHSHGAEVWLISSIHAEVPDYVTRHIGYTIGHDGSRHMTIPLYSSIEQVYALSALACEVADELTPAQLRSGHAEGALSTTYEEMETHHDEQQPQ